MAGRIRELDGLRAVAVSMVVMAHCESTLRGGEDGQWIPVRMIGDGYSGVLLFFVLSGFLITRILLAELGKHHSISLTRFYWHRAIRILPASYTYILTVAILAAFGLVTASSSQLILAVVHLWNYKYLIGVVGPEQGSLVLGHFWSLALEEQFYWVWPLLLLALTRHRAKFLIAVVLIMPIIRVVTYVVAPDLRDHLRIMFHTGVDPIAMGALLACYEDRAKVLVERVPAWAISTAITILFVVAPLMHILMRGLWLITYGLTIELAAAAIVIASLVYRQDHWSARLLRHQPFQYIGMISYSLYLWQQMFCIIGAPFQMMPYFSIPAAILAASASFYLIEQPTRRWRNVFWLRPQRGAASNDMPSHVTTPATEATNGGSPD